jgi:hypothetical protein
LGLPALIAGLLVVHGCGVVTTAQEYGRAGEDDDHVADLARTAAAAVLDVATNSQRSTATPPI